MKKLMFIFGLGIIATAFGPLTAGAQSPRPGDMSQFRFEVDEAQSPHRGRGVEGYVYNDSPWRITNVRLRVESVDETGHVTGDGSGWVIGDVKAGGRGYFFVLVAPGAAGYRATVQSYDRVVLETPQLQAP